MTRDDAHLIQGGGLKSKFFITPAGPAKYQNMARKKALLGLTS